MFRNVTDDIEVKKFLDKDKILEIVSEEDIFEMIFGFKPKEFDYVTSPFRQDNKPGCWFEYSISGKLKFIDWASDYYVNGVKMVSMDCFDAVKLYYQLTNFYDTLHFIYNHLIQGKEITADKLVKKEKSVKKREKNKSSILIETREFDFRDANFWKKYGISSQQLLEDKVFALKKYKIINTTKANRAIRCLGVSYAYTDFEDGKKKIYSPFASKHGKFITNCGKDDIGGLKALSEKGEKLIITKSYKDYRVLRNQGYDSIWFQNEGMFPTSFTLLPILARFEETIVFFDNDRAGIDASEKLIEYISSINNSTRVRSICTPNPKIKDPSDFIHLKGEKELNEFLKTVI